MKVLILHLSDIHLHPADNSCETKFPRIAEAIQNEESELAAIFIVVSGDVAYSGKLEEYEVARRLLTDLRRSIQERTSVPYIRLVLVPGNHDCDFASPNDVRKIVINNIRASQTPEITEEVERCCVAVQKEFFRFLEDLADAHPTTIKSPLYWEYVFADSNFPIQFRCYNTAWVSELKEAQGSLYYPDRWLTDTAADKSEYVVAVFHHPYNWMPASTFRVFRSHIEETSDLILTGHEHEAEQYHKYSFDGEVNAYLEGSVLQEHQNPSRAGFHATFVNLASQQQRTLSFSWESDRFIPTRHSEGWVSYTRGSRIGKREFSISDHFQRWLDDPGASYVHPVKPDLKLSDIFVTPNLKEFEVRENKETVYGKVMDGLEILKIVGIKRHIIIFGRPQSGKTALAKVLYADYHERNLTPVLISGDDIKKAHLKLDAFQQLVELAFQKQYRNPTLPKFQQLDRDKTVIIIDDFDHSQLNARGRLKFISEISKRYERILIFGDDTLKFEEVATGAESGKALRDFRQFELMQFGHYLRSRLIARWYHLGSEYVEDPEVVEKRIHEVESLINALLGKNFVPSHPVFVLSFIQILESSTAQRSDAGSYGSLYEALITQALAIKGGGGNLDLRMAYLSELAFWMFSEKKQRITEDEWISFHTDYCNKFKIKPSRQGLKDEFTRASLFGLFDQRYGFRHRYAYFYFVARYFRDNLSQQTVRDLVRGLCADLHKQEHASIWLFLTHLSKDPFLIQTIVARAQTIFSEIAPATLQDDVLFLGDMAKTMDKLVLDDRPFHQVKEARLRSLDETPELPEDAEVEEETDEALKLIAQLNTALRTLEVLGQLVKNFPGSLVGDDKFMLVKHCYELGLKTIGMILGVFQKDGDGFVNLVVDRVVRRHPDMRDVEVYRKKLKYFMFWLIEASCFGLIKRTSHAVGHSALGETYKAVRESLKTNASDLIDVSVKLDNLDFPEDEIKPLKKRLDGNVLCERLLRQLVVEHFYLFPTRDALKQKVCAVLGIEMRRLVELNAQSLEEKRIPTSEIRK